MPKVQRTRLPRAVLDHLSERAHQRKIRSEQIFVMLSWLETDPTVPDGKWFKRFEGFVLCGEGKLVKTFLLPEQSAVGVEVV